MKKLRVLVLVHSDLVPPVSLEGHSEKEIAEWKTEFDVTATLREMGHDARPLGVWDDLGVIRSTIDEFKPHVCFNLLEEFHGQAVYDQHVVSYLELIKQQYTGCNPRGLLLAHDKPLMKKILTYHRIATPKFAVFPMQKKIVIPQKLSYPMLVKSATEEASLGISQASVVTSDDKLRDRVAFMHEQIKTDALVEQYIDGRELYVGVLGNDRLQTLPVWEMTFANLPPGAPRIATRKVKWDYSYQKEIGLATDEARDLPSGAAERIARLCKRVYKLLNITGYARMDLRMTEEGRVYIIEANPNPNLAYGEDFAESAERAGLDYEKLLHRILTLGRNYHAAWAT
jgi:D-alanine-D-alanine ligase